MEEGKSQQWYTQAAEQICGKGENDKIKKENIGHSSVIVTCEADMDKTKILWILHNFYWYENTEIWKVDPELAKDT